MDLPYDSTVTIAEEGKIPFKEICFFPQHIWMEIFHFSSMETLYQLSQVCAAFYMPCKIQMNRTGRLVTGYWGIILHMPDVLNGNLLSDAVLFIKSGGVIEGDGFSPFGVAKFTLLGCKIGNTICIHQHFQSPTNCSILIARYNYDHSKEKTFVDGQFITQAASTTETGIFSGLRLSQMKILRGDQSLTVQPLKYADLAELIRKDLSAFRSIGLAIGQVQLKLSYEKFGVKETFDLAFNLIKKDSAGTDATVDFYKELMEPQKRESRQEYGTYGRLQSCKQNGTPVEPFGGVALASTTSNNMLGFAISVLLSRESIEDYNGTYRIISALVRRIEGKNSFTGICVVKEEDGAVYQGECEGSIVAHQHIQEEFTLT